jgi:transposase-like protein
MLSLRHETPVTLTAVAEKLGISARTVRKWANQGRDGRRLQVARIGHRTVRTTWSAVEEFIGDTERLPAPPCDSSGASIRRELTKLDREHGIKIDPKGRANDCDSREDETGTVEREVPVL